MFLRLGTRGEPAGVAAEAPPPCRSARPLLRQREGARRAQEGAHPSGGGSGGVLSPRGRVGRALLTRVRERGNRGARSTKHGGLQRDWPSSVSCRCNNGLETSIVQTNDQLIIVVKRCQHHDAARMCISPAASSACSNTREQCCRYRCIARNIAMWRAVDCNIAEHACACMLNDAACVS